LDAIITACSAPTLALLAFRTVLLHIHKGFQRGTFIHHEQPVVHYSRDRSYYPTTAGRSASRTRAICLGINNYHLSRPNMTTQSALDHSRTIHPTIENIQADLSGDSTTHRPIAADHPTSRDHNETPVTSDLECSRDIITNSPRADQGERDLAEFRALVEENRRVIASVNTGGSSTSASPPYSGVIFGFSPTILNRGCAISLGFNRQVHHGPD